jgi:hypothetical protein
MRIEELFVSDVTRNIAPVVYFHEQSPQKVAEEVGEYIITGGWPADHPNHRRVPSGIHEQYVQLLTGIAAELAKPNGSELPCAWISGFYGSGKSSFAKLLGLSLDGMALPDGSSLSETWLRRDTSPQSAELRQAWTALRQRLNDAVAVVFDIGSVARDNEHIHTVALRQVQARLGYCTQGFVADYELALERDGHWQRFEQVCQEVLGRPWSEVRQQAMAEDDFSVLLHRMFPERYADPLAWFTLRAGVQPQGESPEDAVVAIRDMLRARRPQATVFLVVDEVSQYVLGNSDRVDRLRAFSSALGAGLRGKVWLLALGQQKLDEQADDSFLAWARERFPRRLQVHLAPTNIRDVVHKRLLQKKVDCEGSLRQLFAAHRPDLQLFAYGCEAVTPEEFVESYPLLPGYFELLLEMTTAMRTRSARAQGDDQAIRGLLQMLGELFRAQRLAERDVGALVTLDLIYEVQHTALDSDVQASMARLLAHCSQDATGLQMRVAKAVAMLELTAERRSVDLALVAQCLYDRVDRGNQIPQIQGALDELRQANLLGYSERTGYKLQSSAGEEWERERRDIGVSNDRVSELVQEACKYLLALPERPRMRGRAFPWQGRYSDGRRADDVHLLDSNDDAAITVDLRYLASEERQEGQWIRRSSEMALQARLVWVIGERGQVELLMREWCRSQDMVTKYRPRRESLPPARKLLLQTEEIRLEELERKGRDAVAAAWLSGRLFFRGRAMVPAELAGSFASVLEAAAVLVLPDLFPHFCPTQLQPSELAQLLEDTLVGPSTKFMPTELGILELDAGRYVPSCAGLVPSRVLEYIERESGASGTALLANFGSAPYGYAPAVVKACVAGLLRAAKVRIHNEGTEITAVRDPGVRDLFASDRAFRRATIAPGGPDDVGPQVRARICSFFQRHLAHVVDRDDTAIADAVALKFPELSTRLTGLQTRLAQLPGSPAGPKELARLREALEATVRVMRQTRQAVQAVKRHLDALNDGVPVLLSYDAELVPTVIAKVKAASTLVTVQVVQMRDAEAEYSNVEAAAQRIAAHLGGDRPWRDIDGLADDQAAIRDAYVAARRRILQWQEQEAEQARARIKAREGFATLTADQSHHVLRPIANAVSTTAEDAIAPTLQQLRDGFAVRLAEAEEEANDELDKLQSKTQLLVRVDLGLRNRELGTETEVAALLDEIGTRLRTQIRAGARVRLS